MIAREALGQGRSPFCDIPVQKGWQRGGHGLCTRAIRAAGATWLRECFTDEPFTWKLQTAFVGAGLTVCVVYPASNPAPQFIWKADASTKRFTLGSVSTSPISLEELTPHKAPAPSWNRADKRGR